MSGLTPRGLVRAGFAGHDSGTMVEDSRNQLSLPVQMAGSPQALRLQSFHDRHAATVAGWVTTGDQLRRLAPGTPMPLTEAKVMNWQRPNGQAFVLSRDKTTEPLGYAELNRMAREKLHYWLGHVIVSPAERGKRLGRAFVGAMVEFAFKRLQAKRISLIVLPDNAPAIACYRHVGFVSVAEELHHFLPGEPGTRMLRLEIRSKDLL